jgi:hypothetical protein
MKGLMPSWSMIEILNMVRQLVELLEGSLELNLSCQMERQLRSPIMRVITVFMEVIKPMVDWFGIEQKLFLISLSQREIRHLWGQVLSLQESLTVKMASLVF